MARVLILGGIAESLITFRGALMQKMVTEGHQVFACAPNAPKKIRDALLEAGIVYQEIKIDRTGIKPLPLCRRETAVQHRNSSAPCYCSSELSRAAVASPLPAGLQLVVGWWLHQLAVHRGFVL